MNDLLAIVVALLPDLSLIALGGLMGARLSARLGPEIWAGLDRLNFLILFPALLFVSAAARPIAPGDALAAGLAVWSVMGLGFAAARLLRPWGPERPVDFAGAWQTAYRFNTAIAFVAVAAMPIEAAATMALAVGMAVPVANLLAVGALSQGAPGGWGSRLRAVATNPFLLASLAGVLVGLSGRAVPTVAFGALDRLAQAAVPLALVSIGATMDWRAALRPGRFEAALSAIKLMALPAAALAAAPWLTDDPVLIAVTVVFAALPTASAAHVLAAAYGADRRLASTLVAQSTLLGCLTLPLWIAWSS